MAARTGIRRVVVSFSALGRRESSGSMVMFLSRRDTWNPQGRTSVACPGFSETPSRVTCRHTRVHDLEVGK
jgi:hypothetical protein